MTIINNYQKHVEKKMDKNLHKAQKHVAFTANNHKSSIQKPNNSETITFYRKKKKKKKSLRLIER